MGQAALAIGAISGVVSAVGGVMSAVGQYQQGKAAEAAGKHNAEIMRQQAETANQEARENSKRQRRNNERQLATMRANLSSQGTGVSSGAPLAILGDTASELELRVLDGYRAADNQRSQLLTQADTSVWKGKMAMKSSRVNAFGTLLNTGYKADQGYRQGVNSGTFKGSKYYSGKKFK
jgi:hypothetical protein